MSLSGLTLSAALVILAVTGAAQAATVATNGMVVTAQRDATEIGRDILAAGGNAIDAAVAVGYALAVTDPCCGNIGGGGFMVIHLADGRDTFLDFRETAPAADRAALYLDSAGRPDRARSRYGYLAAAVPGTVMGLDRALREYGTMDRRAAMAPAIALARDGYVLSPAATAIIDGKASHLAADPEAAKIFRRADGSPLLPGDRLVQPALAATLTLIAQRGPDAFYRGPIAAAVAAASSANGGVLSTADFAGYTVHETAPLSCLYRGYTVVSAPPPSSGGVTMCEILDVLSGYDVAASGFHSVTAVHVLAEAMRRAFRDRNADLGDPAFVDNPVARLLSGEHAAAIRAAILPDRAGQSRPPSGSAAGGAANEGPVEKPETTHYSIVDRQGNAVAVTYTINGFFGAAVVAPGTGFLLNDEIDDFTIKPGAANGFGLVQGDANLIAPGKRPLSSMAPTIVEKDGKVVLVLGSPGGPRIITTTLETLIDIVDYRMTPEAAVAAPRLHHQWEPDKLYYERGGLPPETVARLAAMGYALVPQDRWGAVELIAVEPTGAGAAASRRLIGVNDDRRPDGAALGY